MLTSQFIESKLEFVQSRPILSLVLIILLGLSLRLYFTPWHLPMESFDAFIFMIEGLAYSNGDFSSLSHRFLWPMFLSVFFLIFKFDSYFEYMTLVRILSITVSTLTVPVVYLISKGFVEKRYALLSAIFFTAESNLVENSIFGITEPLFILFGLLSFYFIVQKNVKYFPLAFVFAGLAFDTRINGVVLILILIVVTVTKIKSHEMPMRIFIIGFLILFAVIAPINLIYPILEGSRVLPYIDDTVSTISSGQEYYSTYELSKTPSSLNIIQNSIKNEVMNFFRITVPYLIILFPFGMLMAIKSLNYEKKMLFAVIIFSLVIAIPQHTISNEYRNLFFIIPFLCIFSALTFQKLTEKIKLKNIFLVLLICGVILISANFLRDRYNIDEEYFIEKDGFGKYVANNLEGSITGNVRLEIIRNMPNLKTSPTFFNERLSVFDPGIPINSVSKLMDYCTQNKINYLVMEYNKDEKHYPVFNEIMFNEDKFPFLNEVYDSQNLDYKKLKVKIFKIDFEKYQELIK